MEDVEGASGFQIFGTPDPQTEFGTTPLTSVGTDRGGARSAFVPGAPSDGYFALSHLQSGEADMAHPITQPGHALSFPTVAVTSRCAAETATVSVTDPLFDVQVAVTHGDQPVTARLVSSEGGDSVYAFTVDRSGDDRNYQVVVTNSVGAIAKGYIQANGCRIFSMGDSYSSGEGSDTRTEPFQNGTNEKGVNMCHRGRRAFGPLLFEDIDNDSRTSPSKGGVSDSRPAPARPPRTSEARRSGSPPVLWPTLNGRLRWSTGPKHNSRRCSTSRPTKAPLTW